MFCVVSAITWTCTFDFVFSFFPEHSEVPDRLQHCVPRSHASIFHEGDDVCIIVTKRPTNQKSGFQQHCSVLCLVCVLHVA